MSETKRNPVQMTGSWIDLCATDGYDDIAGVEVSVQSRRKYNVSVVFGGADAPGHDEDGLLLLQPSDAARGSSDHIWVRGDAGAFVVVHKEA